MGRNLEATSPPGFLQMDSSLQGMSGDSPLRCPVFSALLSPVALEDAGACIFASAEHENEKKHTSSNLGTGQPWTHARTHLPKLPVNFQHFCTLLWLLAAPPLRSELQCLPKVMARRQARLIF